MASQNPTALVTGANQGIGFGTCCQLAKKGYNLVLACRNKDNAEKACQIIQQENPSITVEYVLIDLANLESVQACIRTLIEQGHQFDVIVLNAGVVRPSEQKTVDGYETTFQVNYLSQYLLAQHLINNQSQPIKIVTLTSIIYNLCNLIPLPKKASKWVPMFNETKNQVKAYALTKFALALLSQAFNQQEGVSSVCVHPGVAPTSIFTNSISRVSRKFVKSFLKNRLISAHGAAENVVSCVLVNEIPEGQYNCSGKIVRLNSKARSQQNIKNLMSMNKDLMEKHGICQ